MTGTPPGADESRRRNFTSHMEGFNPLCCGAVVVAHKFHPLCGIAPQGRSWKEPLVQLLPMGTPPISPNCCGAGGVWTSPMEPLHPLKPCSGCPHPPGDQQRRALCGTRSENSAGLSRGSYWGSGTDGREAAGVPLSPKTRLLSSQGTSNGTSGSTAGRNPTSVSTASASSPTPGPCSATSASTPVRMELFPFPPAPL